MAQCLPDRRGGSRHPRRRWRDRARHRACQGDECHRRPVGARLTQLLVRPSQEKLARVLRSPQLWPGRSKEQAMISEQTVGFEPADSLAKDPESVRKRFWAKFKRVAAKLPFAEDLLSAYYCAFDQRTPRHVRAALLGAIAYFILPFDFIPDMLPVLGYTDDAAVLATAIRMVAAHIKPEHRDAARAALKRVSEPKI